MFITTATRTPGHDHRDRDRDLDLAEPLHGVMPMPRAALAQRRVDVGDGGVGVADDRQLRIEQDRNHRRQPADALADQRQDRDHQPEERDRRDGDDDRGDVEDHVGDASVCVMAMPIGTPVRIARPTATPTIEMCWSAS
jgi:hypothetical protein